MATAPRLAPIPTGSPRVAHPADTSGSSAPVSSRPYDGDAEYDRSRSTGSSSSARQRSAGCSWPSTPRKPVRSPNSAYSRPSLATSNGSGSAGVESCGDHNAPATTTPASGSASPTATAVPIPSTKAAPRSQAGARYSSNSSTE